MCGIVGIWGLRSEAAISAMVKSVRHRGPDDNGRRIFSDPEVSLGHARLSIIDLSKEGHQPMANEDDSIWITFNGEIYNFQELRDILVSKGHTFRSKTDSEVLVHGFEEWGEDLFAKLNGIFAVAILDIRKRKIHLARDRFGVKPLYICEIGSKVLFASEIKAILAFKEVPREVNEEALLAMTNYRYCPEPLTLFRGIRKLPPGNILSLGEGGKREQKRFYRLEFEEPVRAESVSFEAETLRGHLAAAVQRQMIADVEVGFFLSGGIDSSALVALAKRQNPDKQFRSFTIGFREEDHKGEGQPDDLVYARKVAEMFGCDHQEIILDPKIVESLPKVVWQMDEPIADPAAISSILICEEAKRQGVKVLLSGQGGDEVFCGYPWHLGAHLASRYRKVPMSIRALIETIGLNLPAAGVGALTGPSRRLRKFLQSASGSFEDSILGFLSYAREEDLQGLFGEEGLSRASRRGQPHVLHRRLLEESAEFDDINRLLYLDFGTFLPSLNLTYTDKTSMAHGVEVRVPLIDNEIVDYMAKRDPRLKLNGRSRKYLLKKCLEKDLPRDVLYRKKGGFGAPIRSWVRRDLREMIGDLLCKERIHMRGFFDPNYVQKILKENQNGRMDHSYLIYFLLSFEIW